jgi:hypothetical protein
LTSWRVLEQISTATTLYLEFHVQLHSIELKMHHRLVEIVAGCLCRWAALLCTIAWWCQQRNSIFILCTFVLHCLLNLHHTKFINLMCSHICLYIGRFFCTFSHTRTHKIPKWNPIINWPNYFSNNHHSFLFILRHILRYNHFLNNHTQWK